MSWLPSYSQFLLHIKFFNLPIDNNQVRLPGWIIKPTAFDPKQQYPLLFLVYGEPAGQTVLDRWMGQKGLWHRMLAQQGILVASIDNRGTPAPLGRTWRKSIYRQVGILAAADQADAAHAMLKKWSFIDPNRIGIWGWSGGGSMTLNAMFRYPDLYRMGMAVAFVSDMHYYDTIYQERYMGLSSEMRRVIKMARLSPLPDSSRGISCWSTARATTTATFKTVRP